MVFLQKIRELVWEHPWILAITIPGLAYVFYWIWMKIHPTARNGKDAEIGPRSEQ
jgi:hypothetical protein